VVTRRTRKLVRRARKRGGGIVAATRRRTRSLERRVPILDRRRKRRRLEKTDVVVVSFPKSGRTWVRYALAHYLSLRAGVPLDTGLNRSVGSVGFEHLLDNSRPGPLFPEALLRKRLVVLVRDPRDVAVSHYHHSRHRTGSVDFELREFLDHPLYGIERQSAFVLDLLDVADRHLGDVHVMSYERLRGSTESEMRRFLRFALDEPVDEHHLRGAVAASDFANMRRWETELSSEGAQRKGLGRAEWDGRTERLKVRRGAVGGFRSEMDEALQADVSSRPMTRRLLERLAAIEAAASRANADELVVGAGTGLASQSASGEGP